MKYHICQKQEHTYITGSGKIQSISSAEFSNAIVETHKIIDQIAGFKVNIFEKSSTEKASSIFISSFFSFNISL